MVDDFNEDGFVDIVVSTLVNTFDVYLGCDVSNLFCDPVEYEVEQNIDKLFKADIDHDGDLDLIAIRLFDDAVLLYKNTGTGVFVFDKIYEVSDGPIDLDFADINNDGWLDIIVACKHANSVDILLSDHAGSFSQQIRLPAGVEPVSLAVGDVDLDSNIDILVVNLEGQTLDVFVGLGGGNFLGPLALGIATNPVQVELYDVDTDGILDIVFSGHMSGEIGIQFMKENWIFGRLETVPTNASLFRLIDLNKDGLVEIIGKQYNGYDIIYGDQFGKFNNAQYLYVDFTHMIEFSDCDSDGDADILIVRPGGELSVYLNEMMLCQPDFDRDGELTYYDVRAFIDAFVLGYESADMNKDGVLNFFDVSEFLAAFAAGCPKKILTRF